MSIEEKVRNALVEIASDLEQGIYEHEQQTIQGAIMPLLHALGWNVFKVKEVTREYSVDEKKVDIALRNGEDSLVFIEAKAVGKITDESVKQAFTYASYEAVPLLVLTDGQEWNFYLPLATGKRPDRQFYKLHISKGEQELDKCMEIFCAYLSREEVISNRAKVKAENALQEKKTLEKQKKDTVRQSPLPQTRENGNEGNNKDGADLESIDGNVTSHRPPGRPRKVLTKNELVLVKMRKQQQNREASVRYRAKQALKQRDVNAAKEIAKIQGGGNVMINERKAGRPKLVGHAKEMSIIRKKEAQARANKRYRLKKKAEIEKI